MTATGTKQARSLAALQHQVVACEACPRLVAYRRRIAKDKRRAYQEWTYWGRPVPSFGDPLARLLIIGLAPGAHGANRTGRMFTGDSSGDFLYPVLHEAGFASQPHSADRADGLRLIGCYITAPVRCAPPDNKPSASEFQNCRPFLERELDLLKNVEVVVVLGRLALGAYLTVLQSRGQIERISLYPFAHGVCHKLPAGRPLLVCSYHPSRQNTQTGRLTKSMFLKVFTQAQVLLDGTGAARDSRH
jgi:uracil-DNA glycosylase family 4